MPSLSFILGGLLTLSLFGNVFLSHLYVNAEKEVASVSQAYKDFTAGVKVASDKQAKAAKAKDEENAENKRIADEENKRKHDADAATIAKLRGDAAKRDSRGGSMSQAPSGSKCPKDQTCFDTALYQLAIGNFDTATRRISDECTAINTDLDTIIKWAQPPIL